MKTLYRYEIEYTSEDGGTDVNLRELSVIRETEHCYFVNPYYYPHKERRILKTAMNTYAYDTKEKAKEHFIRRTENRIRWFKFWIEECEQGLEIIKKI
jgi:hypothetical protein